MLNLFVLVGGSKRNAVNTTLKGERERGGVPALWARADLFVVSVKSLNKLWMQMNAGQPFFTSQMKTSIILNAAFRGNTEAHKVKNQGEAYMAVWNPWE